MLSDAYRQSATFRAEQLKLAEKARLAKLADSRPSLISILFGRGK